MRGNPHERYTILPLQHTLEERTVRSVANLTRKDGEDLLAIAPRVPVKTEVELFPFVNANEALNRLREGRIQGAAVLITNDELKSAGSAGPCSRDNNKSANTGD